VYNVIGMWAINKTKKGFTLIELLVTIAIIAIISASIGIISVPGNLKKGRDNKRITNLEAVRSALEQYRADNSGVYPVAATWTDLKNVLNVYIDNSSFPVDPLSTQSYLYVSSLDANNRRTRYCLGAKVELTSNAKAVTGCSGSCVSAACDYFVAQP
jgi:prepilin-type N-terminal cleavage/methylation domain-containing protein